tara:strand:+ start:2264 stop:2953 length:690 start_codon:yes stop_codon:yes gene_type:complete
MLALKLGLSLNTIKPYGEWTPAGDSGLVAWYQKGRGVTLEPTTTNVQTWADSSGNGRDMKQLTLTEQPAYNAGTGIITFDSSKTQNLQTAGQISLSGEFTIAMRLNMDTAGGVPIADNTSGGEFIKFSTSSQMRIKIDNSQVDITLNGGTTFGDNYLVITRDSSDNIKLYVDGVAQTDTETLAGTADIDALGVRKPNLNPFNGTMTEIQIYSEANATLTANVNEYLSNL